MKFLKKSVEKKFIFWSKKNEQKMKKNSTAIVQKWNLKSNADAVYESLEFIKNRN